MNIVEWMFEWDDKCVQTWWLKWRLQKWQRAYECLCWMFFLCSQNIKKSSQLEWISEFNFSIWFSFRHGPPAPPVEYYLPQVGGFDALNSKSTDITQCQTTSQHLSSISISRKRYIWQYLALDSTHAAVSVCLALSNPKWCSSLLSLVCLQNSTCACVHAWTGLSIV